MMSTLLARWTVVEAVQIKGKAGGDVIGCRRSQPVVAGFQTAGSPSVGKRTFRFSSVRLFRYWRFSRSPR
jgi:hypothetical protein